MVKFASTYLEVLLMSARKKVNGKRAVYVTKRFEL